MGSRATETLAPHGAEVGEGHREMDGGILYGYGAYRRIFSSILNFTLINGVATGWGGGDMVK